ncbi:MAG: Hsp70 family protein [Actinomycetota bacterium]
MSYDLGVDLGTTYSAAAVHRDGRASIASLGGRAPTIPSVVLVREDGAFLVGDAAERRASSEPERVVREFKRRIGDPTPVIVGGAPHSAESLMATLLSTIVETVAEAEGGPPGRMVLTHPANWGDYKVELLRQAVSLAGLDGADVSFLTEPQAAAVAYAATERVDAGEIVAVYDLGGGTFDAAVLRRTDSGFSIMGRPEGIDRLGGIDFDAAVFNHVTMNLGDALSALDPADPAAVAAVSRLRRDCVDAKEALSGDTDAVIPVLLPGHQTDVRITRAEFEALIRPALADSVDALERAIDSAGLQIADVARVLLVGGSSRIPLVSLLLSSQLGRPLAVDTHPKHTVALGAAYAAGGLIDRERNVAPGLEGGVSEADRAAGDRKLSAAQAGMTRVSDNPPPLFTPAGPPGAPPAATPPPAPATPPPVAAPQPAPAPRPAPATPPPVAAPQPAPGVAGKAQRVDVPGPPPGVGGAPRPGGPAPSSGGPAPSSDGPAPSSGGRSGPTPAKAVPVAHAGPPPAGGINARPDAAPAKAAPVGTPSPAPGAGGPPPEHLTPGNHVPLNPSRAGSPPGLEESGASSSGRAWLWWVLLLVVVIGAGVGVALSQGVFSP